MGSPGKGPWQAAAPLLFPRRSLAALGAGRGCGEPGRGVGSQDGVWGGRAGCGEAEPGVGSQDGMWGGSREQLCPAAECHKTVLRSARAQAASRAVGRPLYVTVVYRGKCSHCMRIGVAVPISGTVARLREAVSAETKIPTEQVRAGLVTRGHGLPARVGCVETEIPCPGRKGASGVVVIWIVVFSVRWLVETQRRWVGLDDPQRSLPTPTIL